MEEEEFTSAQEEVNSLLTDYEEICVEIEDDDEEEEY
jgi:hypothetical protein